MRRFLLLLLFVCPFGLFAQKTVSSVQPNQTSSVPGVESLKKDLSVLKIQRKTSLHEYNIARSQLNANFEELQKARDEALVLNKKLDSLNERKSAVGKDKIQRKFDNSLVRLDSLTGLNKSIEDQFKQKSNELKSLDYKIRVTQQQIKDIEDKNKKLKT